jgi:branched-chain amino acid transport system permease protein
MALGDQTATNAAAKWHRAGIARWGAFLLVFAAALAVPLVLRQPFHQHVLITILQFGAMATAWNIIGGLGGQPAFGHSVFFAVGAYTSGLLFMRFGITPWIGMLVGGILAMLVSILVGFPTFRLRGHYFAIGTMATGEIARQVVLSTKSVTGGPLGLPIKVLPQSWYIVQFHGTKLPYYYIILAIFGIAFLVHYKVEHSRLGFYLRTISESHEAAQSLGINTRNQKLLGLAVSAFLTALVGSFTAQYLLFVDPAHVLSMAVSTKIMLCGILGGVGSRYGPILGAILLLGSSEMTRAWMGGQGRGIDLFIYGLLIVMLMVFEPFGLLGIYRRVRARLARRPSSEAA